MRESTLCLESLVERQDGRLYNSAVLISPAGEVLLRHRKLNELEYGEDAEELAIVEAPLSAGVRRYARE
ncbi:MAG: hypothetical protein IT168_06135 [Bryobacterales bacterium]|nr:hypothetical protein [Bryobacterales bacterium]